MNVATTEIVGQFPGSQSGAGSDNVNNQPGAAFQHSMKRYQGIREVAPYPPLSVGLGGARADFETRSNTLGLGANMPTDPYVTDSASDGLQVNPSLLPSVPCSDRPTEHRQCPGPNPRQTVPPSTTPKQENTPIVLLEW